MLLLHRPSPKEIAGFLAESAALPLSYEPVGLARSGAAGFNTDEHRVVIGSGAVAFERAKTALATWKHFDLGWVELHPPAAPVQIGSVVAAAMRHLGFWSLNGCRVVYMIEEDNAFGFAYGTLTNHAECGEEIFKVSISPDTGDVSYEIQAASHPRAVLVWLGYPVARQLQARFRRDSSNAMRNAVK
jgi:uncharacterized protein (UPF0548 family)